ncbi:MAG TPA: hypothetical protein VF397_02030 [Pyrinomonadaceae bacterium]
MKQTRIVDRSRTILVLLVGTLCATASNSFAQQAKPTKPSTPQTSQPANSKLSLEQELALSLIRRLADEVKGEADKPGAALIQAQAADTLWEFDEPAARTLFRLAFDTVNSPAPEASVIGKDAKTNQAEFARLQASVLKEIIVMLGKRDQVTAERWLDSMKKEETTKEIGSLQLSQERAEFLAQLASQLAMTNPAEAEKLGLMSLGANEVPSAFGPLLFALKRSDSARSDALFRAAIAALRRTATPGRSTLSALSNYLFVLVNGNLFQIADAPTARLFTDYLLEAATIQAALTREALSNRIPMPETAANLTNFLALKGLDIIGVTAPDKVTLLQSLLTELSSALNQQQRDDLAQMSAGLRQQESLDRQSGGNLESQIDRAEHEKDAVVRDSLWRSLAIGMMRGNPDHALSMAARIDDRALREQTQDDVNLVVAGDTVRGGGYEEARKVALKFNDTNLRSKTLAELANRVWTRSRNREQASQLLDEAYEVAAKGEPSADRAAITLLLAEKFARFDAERSFGLVDAAIKTINQVQIAGPPQSSLKRRPGIQVMSFTVVGGAELTTGSHATLTTLKFQGLGEVVRKDYFRSRNMGDNIQNRILRARYLVTLAQSFLIPNHQ